MTRRGSSEAVDCFFTNGLWLPGRLVSLQGDIDTSSSSRALTSLTILAATADPLFITLNSPGGSAIDGMAIFDAVSNLSNHVTITVFGEAASMGAIILQAADLRLMASHAILMLHEGTDSVSDLHVRDFERRAEESKRSRSEMYEIFAARTSKTKAYWRRKLAHDCYYTAEQALKEGLIDGCVKRT